MVHWFKNQLQIHRESPVMSNSCFYAPFHRVTGQHFILNPLNKIHMADSKKSVHDLKKTIYCLHNISIFSFLLQKLEYTEKIPLTLNK